MMHKNIEADLHIHTVSSGHAYSTVAEIIVEAQKKGLKTIAITDHGPALPGAPHHYHFSNLRVIDSLQNGIRILKGVEANIIDIDGNLDLDKEILDRLDIVLATFHPHCGYEDLGAEMNTETLIKALKKNKIDIIAHPGNRMFKLNYEKVAKAAFELDILIEFNNSSYVSKASRSGVEELDYELATYCKKYGNKVVLTSDAHIASDVGKLEKSWELVTRAGIHEEQILNIDNEKLLKYLESKR